MTIGDFLDKHFWAIWWLGASYVIVRFLLVGVISGLRKSLDDD